MAKIETKPNEPTGSQTKIANRQSSRERRRILVQGLVQGVGFRPFVYGLAVQRHLAGRVWNDAAGVVIEVEGEAACLDDFLRALQQEAPPLAEIERVAWEMLPPRGRDTQFVISRSRTDGERHTLVSPDMGLCHDCLHEMLDPADRRHRYPFINCTNCGPRFTIIHNLPYDRRQTTMASFTMCGDCQREYDTPSNRRFHAQPNACPACGPHVHLLAPGGERVDKDQAIIRAARLLQQGLILAIKGLGGYHLACDATNEAAVARLRRRKHRWDKPLALMAPDLETVKTLCQVDSKEQALLTSQQRPIVLLTAKPSARRQLAAAIAPGLGRLGFMLPYTPLHVLLLQAVGRVLVMTSGNQSDEPIAYEDEDARRRLGQIADAFLCHNRDIHIRCDDSVARVVAGKPLFLRRSRGYAPQPLRVAVEFEQPVLAVGAHLKNTFCLGRGRYAFLSQHIGDLENLETLTSFVRSIEHFKRLFNIEPAIIAHDMHPDYLSTRWANGDLGFNESAIRHPPYITIPVQHHHAHIAGVMAEHGLAGAVIGLAFDGAGYGPDGTVWGGEVFIAHYAGYRRVAHLALMGMPGSEQAIHQPWRMAAAYLYQTFGSDFKQWPLDFVARLKRAEWRGLKSMIDRQVNTPLTSSMGRLFDAIAALLGIRHKVNYEGQAAIELEALASQVNEAGDYPFEFVAGQPTSIETRPLIRAVVADLQKGAPKPVIAARFHNTIVSISVAISEQLRRETKLKRVALRGGVFQNAYLLARTRQRLAASGFEVYCHHKVPPNDGGLALGQAVIAAAKLNEACDRPSGGNTGNENGGMSRPRIFHQYTN